MGQSREKNETLCLDNLQKKAAGGRNRNQNPELHKVESLTGVSYHKKIKIPKDHTLKERVNRMWKNP